jgi:tetratricopeptide (TPR) repeat protein
VDLLLAALFGLGCLGLSGVPSAVAQGPSSASAEPAAKTPALRPLTGEDARRVKEWEAELVKAEEAGRFADAGEAARRILEKRQQAQGEGHWEAVSAAWQLKALERVAALPADAQKEWRALGGILRESAQYVQRGRYAEAQRLDEKALVIRRNVLGEDHPDTAQSYNDLAYSLNAQGKYAEAQRHFEKGLAFTRKALGEDHPQTAICYNNVAYNLHTQGRYAEAQPLYAQALVIFRKVLGEEHSHTAAGYNNVAGNLADQGKYSEAQPLYEKALTIRRKALGEEHPDTAICYNNVAHNLDALGKYPEAQPLYEKSLAIRRKALGEEHPSTALAYNNVAFNLDAQGKYPEAQPLYEKALAIFRKALGEEHPSTAACYENVATNLNAQGKYAKAQPLYEKALTIRRKALGEEHPDTATSINNLALTFYSQRKYAETQPLFEKALAIRRKALGEDHPQTAQSYQNLAANLAAQEKHAAAQPLFEKALAIKRKALGEEHPDTAQSYNNVANNLDAQGKYAEAQPLFEKALAIARKALGEDHPETATYYHNIASNLDAQGKFAEAQPLYEKALALRRRALGEEHPETAFGYDSLASNLYAQRKYAEAEAAGTKAAASFDQARTHFAFTGLGRSARTAVYSPLSVLAAVLARNGKPAEAWHRLEESLGRGLLDDLAGRQARRLSPGDRTRQRDLLARLERLDKLFANLPAGKADAPELQKLLADLSRQRSAAQAACSAFEAELVQRFGVAAGEVYDLAAIQKQLAPDTALVAWLDLRWKPPTIALEVEHWACVVRHRGAPAWVRVTGSGTHDSWTNEDDLLPEGVAAVCASSTGAGDRAWVELAARLGRQRLAPVSALLAGQEGLPAVKHLVVLPSPWLAGVPVEVLLGPRGGFTVSYAPSGTLLAWLLAKRQVPPSTAPNRPPALLALADPVFLPTAARPAGPYPGQGVLLTEVFPDSAADHAALRQGDVLLKYGTRELSSPEDLVAAVQRTAQAPGAREVRLAVWRNGKTLDLTLPPGRFGVRIDRRPAPQALKEDRAFAALLRSARGGTFDALPGTRREVGAVAQALQDRDKDAAVTTLFGSDANEQRLADLLAGEKPAPYRFIHLATHGVADERFALRSALILSQDKLPDPLEQVLHAKPVYDGRLTAAEVLQHWNLDADLVVLSACQSGRGKHEGGEGFVGFSQALLLAGAHSVVVSLWKVDDTATALLMQRFYQNLLGSRTGLDQPMPKAEALGEAKQWLRELPAEQVQKLVEQLPPGERGERVKARAPAGSAKPYAHPHYWAAFILIGDPN